MSVSTPPVPVTVLAHILAKRGSETELRRLLSSLVGPTRLEEGCLNYDLHESAEESGQFMFHENWRSRADLDRHLASPHVTAVLSKVPELVAAPPRITLWRKSA